MEKLAADFGPKSGFGPMFMRVKNFEILPSGGTGQGLPRVDYCPAVKGERR